MLAPAPRDSSPLPRQHPCHGCDARETAACGVLDCEELATFRNLGIKMRLAPGQPLFHQGAPANRVFTLTSGTLKLYKLLPDGRRQVTGFLHAGDFLGASMDGEHAFSAEAVERAELCAFAHSRFDDFVEAHADMERELYRNAMHELAAAQQQMVLLGRKTAAERLCSFFLGLLERIERHAGERSDVIELPMSRSDVADYLGLTKETISRVIGSLKSRRVIRLQSLGRVQILDRQVLTDIAEGATD